MRILVTGGAGFIGSHLVDLLQREGHEVVVVDDFSTGSERNLEAFEGRIIRGSILDAECMARAFEGVELVFHLAGYVSAPGSMAEPRRCAELNVGGLLTALEAARDGGCGRVVFASSAAVYGNGPEMPKVEGLSPTPESPYALTKLDGERYLRMLGPMWGFATTAVRFFNVFGPRQNIATGYAAAVPNFCSLAARGKEIRIYGDGEQTRDFVYVEDLVSALHHLACTGVHSGIYNVGYGESLTINSLAKSIIEMSGSSSKITYDVERPGDVRHSLADVARLRATGWKATVGMQDGLMRTIGFHANS
jgi:UDP-glucose 4-epimerase